MAVMDEFSQERETVKHGTLKEKISYFIDYYKWHVIVVACIITAGLYTVLDSMGRRDTALYTCLLNTTELDATRYNAGFADTLNIDTERNELVFESDTFNSLKLTAQVAAGEIDIIITDPDSISYFSYQENFFTMDELLPPELYEKYKPYFYYIDLADLEKWQSFNESQEGTLPDRAYHFPNPRKPEKMDSPVAVGIFLDECKELKECYRFRSNDVVFSVFANTDHKDTALAYLDYLMR